MDKYVIIFHQRLVNMENLILRKEEKHENVNDLPTLLLLSLKCSIITTNLFSGLVSLPSSLKNSHKVSHPLIKYRSIISGQSLAALSLIKLNINNLDI